MQRLGPGAVSSKKTRIGIYLFFLGSIAALIFLVHAPLARLPFYWDELGQFVPASLDLYQLGRWIPVTTVPNIHPPGLMAYLALFWRGVGYSILASRLAMLAIASLGAFFTFLLAIRIARGTAGFPAFSATIFLICSPLFFAQSMLVQLDMPAMTLTCLAILLFLRDRFRRCALVCTVLVLVKETGLVAPMVFGAWLIGEKRWRPALLFFAPLIPLCVWLCLLHAATGNWAGNASFAAYNAVYTLDPTRFVLALLRRGYYLFLSTGHWIGSLALICALRNTPVFYSRSWRVVGAFAVAHILFVTLFGGAVLERYLLPVLPLLYIAFAVAITALSAKWRILAPVAMLAALITAIFLNPPYPFPMENNLAFSTFVSLHRQAAEFVENSYPHAEVVTTFPLAGAMRRKDFGYVSRTLLVHEIPNFEAATIRKLASRPPDVLLLYDVAWDPFSVLRNSWIRGFLQAHYGYEPPLTSLEISSILPMHRAARWEDRGQWIEVLESDTHPLGRAFRANVRGSN